jgi:hypothetical protein
MGKVTISETAEGEEVEDENLPPMGAQGPLLNERLKVRF